MKTPRCICTAALYLFLGRGLIGNVLSAINRNERELHVAVGDTGIVICPVETESVRENKIESIRWTKGSIRKFVGQRYEDGSSFCINERYSLDYNNPLTLVISNTELSDTELYVCRIRSTVSELHVFVGYVHFMVYELFVLSIHIQRGNDWEEVAETNSVINRTIGDDLRVRCNTVRQNSPIKLNWIEVNNTIRSNENAFTLSRDNEQTVITELMIKDVGFHNEGVYSCKASYGNSQQSLQQLSFSLKITMAKDAVVYSSISPSIVGRNLAKLMLDAIAVMVAVGLTLI
ncbi:uncharacterized protein [Ptychodera flava]|uniref:uncharacterized protein n=1 Tax=Ptychodera flava TaxID=63121 RepID=UPI00396A64E5